MVINMNQEFPKYVTTLEVKDIYSWQALQKFCYTKQNNRPLSPRAKELLEKRQKLLKDERDRTMFILLM